MDEPDEDFLRYSQSIQVLVAQVPSLRATELLDLLVMKGSSNVDLVILPQDCVIPSMLEAKGEGSLDLNENADLREISDFCAERRLFLILGSVTEEKEEGRYSVALVFNDKGEEILRYRRRSKSSVYQLSGSEVGIFEHKGLKIGLLIGEDADNMKYWMELASREPNMIVHVTKASRPISREPIITSTFPDLVAAGRKDAIISMRKKVQKIWSMFPSRPCSVLRVDMAEPHGLGSSAMLQPPPRARTEISPHEELSVFTWRIPPTHTVQEVDVEGANHGLPHYTVTTLYRRGIPQEKLSMEKMNLQTFTLCDKLKRRRSFENTFKCHCSLHVMEEQGYIVQIFSVDQPVGSGAKMKKSTASHSIAIESWNSHTLNRHARADWKVSYVTALGRWRPDTHPTELCLVIKPARNEPSQIGVIDVSTGKTIIEPVGIDEKLNIIKLHWVRDHEGLFLAKREHGTNVMRMDLLAGQWEVVWRSRSSEFLDCFLYQFAPPETLEECCFCVIEKDGHVTNLLDYEKVRVLDESMRDAPTCVTVTTFGLITGSAKNTLRLWNLSQSPPSMVAHTTITKNGYIIGSLRTMKGNGGDIIVALATGSRADFIFFFFFVTENRIELLHKITEHGHCNDFALTKSDVIALMPRGDVVVYRFDDTLESMAEKRLQYVKSGKKE